MITVQPLKESKLPWEQIYRKFAAILDDRNSEIISLNIEGYFQEVADKKTLGKKIGSFDKSYGKNKVFVEKLSSKYDGYDLRANIKVPGTSISTIWISIFSKGISIRSMDDIGEHQADYLPKDFEVENWKRVVTEEDDYRKAIFKMDLTVFNPSKTTISVLDEPIPFLDILEISVGY